MAASMATFKAVGDWSKKMDVPLNNALQASVELTGRSGRQACDHAIVLMAQTARKHTKTAKKNRKMGKDEHGRFIQSERKSRLAIYEWWWSAARSGKAPSRVAQFFTDHYAVFEDAKATPNRGLAKRSWFWGIRGLKGGNKDSSKKMPGVAKLDEFLGDKSSGLILTNRLSYIKNATPATVEQIAAKAANNQIMAQAAKKLERRFSVEIPRLAAQRSKRAKARLDREFKKRHAA